MTKPTGRPRGRPRKYGPDESCIGVRVYMPSSLREALDEVVAECRADSHTTRSELVVEAVREWLRERPLPG